ncbi:potassium-transporting ATPase subunit KdpB [Adlercreutzia sp. JBNU-10]|uniref:Potassium-transporting ATPase ATP-binding subunit n=2 Tax=Adlercreutzia faecimuris TaxID=2897341 RepID=A0ABS9WEK1_9ACTN|nr:potassium-transporting ATPase subunit KdpB [Adlercreutzia sp. JBNU-10]MCI2241298.1 potassium-transporting ATPase subunit KdpB [Adlercreutzia sp. JBNU-10]
MAVEVRKTGMAGADAPAVGADGAGGMGAGATPSAGGTRAAGGPAVGRAVRDAFAKLAPREQARNPVMLMVYLSAILTTALFALALAGVADAAPGFILAVCVILWLTVLFGNFAEALAEGRGRAQADALRSAKRDVEACRVDGVLIAEAAAADDPAAFLAARGRAVSSAELRRGDVYLVRAGEQVPADGEVLLGAASVDESAITGESAPVVRESGGDRSALTGGTTVLSDWLVVRVSAEAGHSFLDQMIAMVESAARKKTPNERALELLLIALTLVFLAVSTALYAFGAFSAAQEGRVNPLGIASLVALFVCLAPTTIGALLSAIGIAGMSRLNQANVLATSGRAVEAAGDVDVLLLDKTGTITLGNRQAAAFLPLDGVAERDLADAAQLASLADETPEGRSVVVLAKERFGIRGRTLDGAGFTVVPFTAQTRMSGVDFGGHEIRKGAADAVRAYVEARGGTWSPQCSRIADEVAREGGTPLVVVRDGRVLGVIHLKDIIKSGIRENFADLHAMGIRTVMVTGDNPLTAAAIAAEAGLDDFIAEATPEAKLEAIRRYQAEGHLVAMTGDGTNDAPALAQADVAVAMNSGTQAAKEAGNMVDLDSSPTKLIEIVRIGKQMLMTRGSLTTFSITNDLAKYFAVIPALLVPLYPGLEALNVMHLTSPTSAMLAAVTYNALIIVALIPLALRGVKYREGTPSSLLARNLAVYGLGGVAVPFVAIKALDVLMTALGAA